MLFKKGDKVRVKSNLKPYEEYSNISNNYYDSAQPLMCTLKGQIVTIKCVGEAYLIKECGYNWTEEMFDLTFNNALTLEEFIKHNKESTT